MLVRNQWDQTKKIKGQLLGKTGTPLATPVSTVHWVAEIFKYQEDVERLLVDGSDQ